MPTINKLPHPTYKAILASCATEVQGAAMGDAYTAGKASIQDHPVQSIDAAMAEITYLTGVIDRVSFRYDDEFWALTGRKEACWEYLSTTAISTTSEAIRLASWVAELGGPDGAREYGDAMRMVLRRLAEDLTRLNGSR